MTDELIITVLLNQIVIMGALKRGLPNNDAWYITLEDQVKHTKKIIDAKHLAD